MLDDQAVVVNADGLSVFDLIRYRQHDRAAVLCAFDLIELDGDQNRRYIAPLHRHKQHALSTGTCRRLACENYYLSDGVKACKRQSVRRAQVLGTPRRNEPRTAPA